MELLPILIPIAFFVVFIPLFIFLYLRNRKHERERTEQFRSTATILGWEFVDNAPFNWIPNLEKFALFSSGHSKSIRNMMYGEHNGVKAAMFDYQYVTGSGKNQQTHNQSVVYFEPRDLNLPFFSLRPEHVFHKLAAAFGYQDIDFGQRPLFSSKYLLRGTDEQLIRNTFSDRVLSFYEANVGTATDGGGNQIFIFAAGKRTEPHQSQAFINSAFALSQLFTHRW